MKTKSKNVYYCDHCNKHGLSEPAMKHHELICNMNPVNDRPCLHCIHLTKKQAVTTYYEYDGYEYIKHLDCLYCMKKEIFLHLPKNDIKNNVHDLDNFINEKMPTECDVYEDQSTYLDNL